jgi:23S rRNA pseudouridine1911/1915/1917 synthase
MIVHAGAGRASAHGTLVNALLYRYRELSTAGDPARPGIVHRLDKETSGVMIVARNDAAHRALAEQFSSRRVQKTYIALLHGAMKQPRGRIELAIARDLKRRTRMTTRRAPAEGRTARTDWRVLARIGAYTLVEADLHTGRTHQIRVHFSALGHPVVGDTLYGASRQPRAGKTPLPMLGRNFLHAARICFTHPRTGKAVEARAALPGGLRDFLRALIQAAGADAASIDAATRGYL